MDTLFAQTNPHAVAAMLKVSETRELEACEDIVDAGGVKLWAKGKTLGPDLMERLLNRRLQRPLEQCLVAQDSVSAAEVAETIEHLLADNAYLAALAAPSTLRLLQTAGEVPLEPPVALLLTTAKDSDNGSFRHACLVMLIAGAMAIHAKVGAVDLERVMLAALLHDLGEIYINPSYLSSQRELTLQEWQHVSVHPRVGELFVQQLTGYPKRIASLVGSHQERLDGTGYPSRLTSVTLDPDAGFLIVAETLAGILTRRAAAPQRAVLAMGLVFGEFPLALVNHLVRIQRSFPISEGTEMDVRAAKNTLEEVREGLRVSLEIARSISQAPKGQVERRTLERLAPLLVRLDAAFVATGTAQYFDLVGHSGDEDAEMVMQLELVPREVRWRMRSLARHTALDTARFSEPGRLQFEPLLNALRGEPAAVAA
jgi:hypothetical protein